MLKSLGLAALLLAIAQPVAAQQGLAGPPSILVTGSAEVEAQPDQFRITVSINGRGATQVEALRNLAAVQTRMMDDLPTLSGLSRSAITTGEIALQPTFDPACGASQYDRDTDDCPVVGYNVGTELTFKGAPAERAGDALSLASELGAGSARVRDYSVSDMRALREAANRAAFADAERQARMLSDASGRRIVGILRIQDPSSRLVGADQQDGEMADVVVTGNRVRGPAVSIAVAPEPVTATSRVTVAFQIE
ncbi:SIMPL domain-containing protein [Brevundimonas sp. GCM10030266]|uniref:SIMPL domain-containing protein n=1 Tax=Brevundimonas sp. GCM10030266 TaxID=3273386 RepID=UPI0036233218